MVVGSPESLLARVLELAAPPVRENLSELADAHRVLSSEASAAPGPCRTLPFQREPLDALSPGSRYESVVLIWASQLGKSAMWMNRPAGIRGSMPGVRKKTVDNVTGFHQLTWDRIEWPPSTPEEAAWRCPACDELIGHHMKHSLVERDWWGLRTNFV
jgi:phage terminase large subunit GpA-like protein